VVSASVAVAAAALAAAALGTSVSAQDGADIGPAVEIRGGTCEQPGDVTALLEALDAPPPPGDRAQRIAISLTDVMQPFSDLTAEPQVIVSDASAIGGGPVCGSIAGQAADDRGLAVPLTDGEGSFAGVAWLSELGLEATSVDVFVIVGSSVPAGLPADGSPAPASPGPSASPISSGSPNPAPSASPGADGVAPGEEIDPSEDIDVDVDES
jgi:hypothetical protein